MCGCVFMEFSSEASSGSDPADALVKALQTPAKLKCVNGRPLRICVLRSSYEGSTSPLTEFDVLSSPEPYYEGPEYITVNLVG